MGQIFFLNLQQFFGINKTNRLVTKTKVLRRTEKKENSSSREEKFKVILIKIIFKRSKDESREKNSRCIDDLQ